MTDLELRAALTSFVSPEWSIEKMLHLVPLWNEGHSTVQIGVRIGVSKNAVVGKIHRLQDAGIVTGRASPIRGREGLDAIAAARREHDARSKAENDARRAADDAALKAFRETQGALAPPPKPKRHTPIALNRPLAPARPRAAERPPAAERPAPAPARYGRISDCCWPLGTPGTRTFRFCDRPTDPGRPYCHTHVGKAYTRVPSPMTAERARG